jgi:branched-chain amino acid transport system substrate-binding protein
MQLLRKVMLIGGAAMAIVAMLGATQQTRVQNIKIGVLTELGGPYADLSGPVEATKMAVEDLKTDLGAWHVDVISADEQSKADIGGAIARQWLDIEHVDVIVNVPNSAVALSIQGTRVQPVVATVV